MLCAILTDRSNLLELTVTLGDYVTFCHFESSFELNRNDEHLANTHPPVRPPAHALATRRDELNGSYTHIFTTAIIHFPSRKLLTCAVLLAIGTATAGGWDIWQGSKGAHQNGYYITFSFLFRRFIGVIDVSFYSDKFRAHAHIPKIILIDSIGQLIVANANTRAHIAKFSERFWQVNPRKKMHVRWK